MKVSSKVALGATLLVSLLLLALWRDVLLVQRLVSAHEELSQVRLVAVTSALDIVRVLDESEEDLQKLFVARDLAYADRVRKSARSVTDMLHAQSQLSLNETERQAIAQCEYSWRDFSEGFAAARPMLAQDASFDTQALRQELTQLHGVANAQALALLAALQNGVGREVDAAQRAGQRFKWSSLGLAVLAVLSGALFVFLTVRSVKRPLSRLIVATRAIGDGRFNKLSPGGADEFAELGRAFDTMVHKLDELDRMKRDFVSRVSHELKTPLAAMQETNQLLLDELIGALNDKQRRLLTLNRDAAKRLSSMLSRLLDVSRLEAGAVAYDVRPVELLSLLAIARGEFEARLADKTITSSLALPKTQVVIFGDRDWLVQVVENLLENAIRFSPRGGAIELGLHVRSGSELAEHAPTNLAVTLRKGTWALVWVADCGPGIADEAKHQVFEKFFQVQKHRAKDGGHHGHGVGLGLAICRDVVYAHGGVLWVADRQGGGSTFFVALPFGAEVSSTSQYEDESTLATYRVESVALDAAAGLRHDIVGGRSGS